MNSCKSKSEIPVDCAVAKPERYDNNYCARFSRNKRGQTTRIPQGKQNIMQKLKEIIMLMIISNSTTSTAATT